MNTEHEKYNCFLIWLKKLKANITTRNKILYQQENFLCTCFERKCQKYLALWNFENEYQVIWKYQRSWNFENEYQVL